MTSLGFRLRLFFKFALAAKGSCHRLTLPQTRRSYSRSRWTGISGQKPYQYDTIAAVSPLPIKHR